MNIKLDDMVEKHKACVNALDECKNCDTCKHNLCSQDTLPCSQCYSEMIGLPINPTKWEQV